MSTIRDTFRAVPCHFWEPRRPAEMQPNLLRVSAATLFVLWCLSSSACAQCSWIVWSSAAAGTKLEWIPIGAFASEDACKRETDNLAAQARNYPAKPIFTCLPDTVDPRGPKGK